MSQFFTVFSLMVMFSFMVGVSSAQAFGMDRKGVRFTSVSENNDFHGRPENQGVPLGVRSSYEDVSGKTK